MLLSVAVRNRLNLILFTAPLLVPLFVFWLIPFGLSIFISFTDWDYISPSYDWVGWDNYHYMLSNSEFLQALNNTFVFAASVVLPTVAIGLGLALLLQRRFAGSHFFRAVIFSPWITPTVAVSIVWSWVFDKHGLINQILGIFQVSSIGWFSHGNTAMFVVVLVTIWQSVGWTMLFFISALNKIPLSIYEATLIDGCSPWRRFFRIILPLISPTTFFLIIVNMINAVQAFDQFQILTQGGPGGETRTLLYWFYQQAFQQYDMGPATATSVIIFVITAILTAINSWMGKRWVYY
ncbi:MAG: Diacetylchitobiose uptake system permease protein NgcF [Candidatus Celerinatantimonas neptuna]|nr:MAG: Diacetylchitobiose uptake system permease protein NgcF [Candidatus Celerinatantimonas neptuna]